MDEIIKKVGEYLATNGVAFALNLAAAAAIFMIGRWVARLISNLVGKAMLKAKVDRTLTDFVDSLVYAVLLIFVIIAALARLGIPMTSAIALVGAAGLAVGLALQGSLANFAAGMILIFFKPFKVGDFIEVGGAKGIVKQIQIFSTILDTPDNICVIIPNAKVTGDNIFNYTVNGTRRVDLVIGVSYEDDLKRAQEVISEVLASDERVLKDPASTVAVHELGDSSVNFVVRPWVKAVDYWDAYFDITTKIKLSLDANGISIPFPQRDVHIKGGSAKEIAQG